MNLCDFCLSPVEVTYDYKAIANVLTRDRIAAGPPNMWRYADLLPADGEPVDIGTGLTPLIRADNLGQELGLDRLYIKNDCLTPTYSFKDRAVSVAVTRARAFGFDTVACLHRRVNAFRFGKVFNRLDHYRTLLLRLQRL